MNTVLDLNPDYWDCDCEKDFIRMKAEEPKCPKCGCWHEDCPDSRQNEIDYLLARTASETAGPKV